MILTGLNRRERQVAATPAASKGDMSIEELIRLAAGYNLILLIFFAALPVCALLLRALHGRERGALSPWKYFYAVLVYLACIPGMLSLVLIGYSLFFLRANLLRVNALIYFLPVLSMFFTLVIIRKSVSFDIIPGFNRLSGLMLLLVVTFASAFILDRLRLWLFFRGSLGGFVLLCLLLFFLFKYGMRLVFGLFKKK